MAMNAKYMSKMKGKMPPPPSKDDEDGADPVFQIDDDEGEESAAKDSDVDNGSDNASPDAHTDSRTVARAKDGKLSETGAEEEGTPDHEESEGPAERGAEKKELAKASDDDLLHELKRRGHPAGEHLNASKGVGKPADGEEAEDWDA